MTRRSRILLTLGVVLVVALAVMSFSRGGPTYAGGVIPAADRAAPISLSGTGLDGERVDLAALRGAPVVLNFWATWCGPCHAEQPDLERAAQATRSAGVHFVGINIREDNAAGARSFVDKYDVSYPNIIDKDLRHAAALGVPAPPATYVLDAQGRVAVRLLGEIGSADELVALITRVAGEPR